MPVFKIDGLIPLAVACVEINDRDLASYQPRFQVFEGDLKYHEIVELPPHTRIEGIDLQRPRCWPAKLTVPTREPVSSLESGPPPWTSRPRSNGRRMKTRSRLEG